MLPENKLSERPVEAEWLPPDNRPLALQEDWEEGGVALQDTSKGLQHQVWRVWSDNVSIYLQPENLSSPAIKVADAVRPRYVCLAFDRNMNYAVAWQLGGITYLKWYDTTIQEYRTVSFSGERNPRLCHDDKRVENTSGSDVLLFTIAGSKLVVRNQRDRYGVVHELRTLASGAELGRCGMTKGLRVQVEIWE